MMYRPHSNSTHRSTMQSRASQRNRRPRRLLTAAALVVVAIVAVVALAAPSSSSASTQRAEVHTADFLHSESLSANSVAPVSSPVYSDTAYLLPQVGSQISQPSISHSTAAYRQLFNDSNYVQLNAARILGINPHTLGDPALSPQLVNITSTSLYKVDSMYHSSPYLIPDAVSLLHDIALRFQQLMQHNYPDAGHYCIVVTSALRTEQSERALRRVNRNATDTSCHIYGTTFDISAQRYLHPTGVDTVVEFCKQMLAQALYELRSQGVCYVKYERGSCFHITLTNPSIQAPPPPKNTTPTYTPLQSRHHRSHQPAKELHGKKTPKNNKTQDNTAKNTIRTTTSQGLTDRERLSFDLFE